MVTLTSCLKIKKNIRDEYNERCVSWIQTLKSANLIFCHVELEERIIERTVGYGSSCLIDVNNNTNQSTSFKFCHDFVVFVDTQVGEDFIEDCVSKTIRVEMLTLWTKLIICDKASEIPERFERRGSLQFLRSANALYVAKTRCWSAGPFYILRRSFSPATDCTADFWVSDTETLPDMRGETVRAVTFDRLLFSVIIKNESDPNKRYDGIEINIFLKVAEILNFTWRMEEIGVEVSNKWGKLVDGKWKGGVMESMGTGRADISLSSFWMDNVTDLDFTYSWSSLNLVFLVPKPTLIGSSWANLARPFQDNLWLSVGLLVLTFPLTAWTLERLYMMHHPGHQQSHLFSGYLLYTAGSLMGGSGALASPRAPGPLKPLVTSWYVAVLLLYACYTSNIASILSIPSYEPPLDTVRQLVEQNFSWGRTYYVDTPTKFVRIEDYWQSRFVEHYITYDPADLRRLLLSGKFALYAQVLEGTGHVLVDSDVDDHILKGLRLMKETLAEYRITTAVPLYSPLKHFYDRVVIRLFELGFISRFKNEALRKYQKSSYENFRSDPDTSLNSEPTVLALDDFKYVFYLLFAGWAISSVSFVLELYTHARSGKGCRKSIRPTKRRPPGLRHLTPGLRYRPQLQA